MNYTASISEVTEYRGTGRRMRLAKAYYQAVVKDAAGREVYRSRECAGLREAEDLALAWLDSPEALHYAEQDVHWHGGDGTESEAFALAF